MLRVPKYEHESYSEDLDAWTLRGVDEDPRYFTCKFCPARAPSPEKVDHLSSCPCSGGEDSAV